jgi:5-methylcytosine-specific restriction endonuclease McrA
MKVEHSSTIENACRLIAAGDIVGASSIISGGYPFRPSQKQRRHLTPSIMTGVFLRDGFIDRYWGTRLVFPPVLRLLSHYLPAEFPYHKNGKMSEGHLAYWELFPTIDHVVPLARGGADSEENWVCCSMLTNSIKSNWTLEQLQWRRLPQDDPAQWDGMVGWFLHQVKAQPALLENPYIKDWHAAAAGLMHNDSLRARAFTVCA